MFQSDDAVTPKCRTRRTLFYLIRMPHDLASTEAKSTVIADGYGYQPLRAAAWLAAFLASTGKPQWRATRRSNQPLRGPGCGGCSATVSFARGKARLAAAGDVWPGSACSRRRFQFPVPGPRWRANQSVMLVTAGLIAAGLS